MYTGKRHDSHCDPNTFTLSTLRDFKRADALAMMPKPMHAAWFTGETLLHVLVDVDFYHETKERVALVGALIEAYRVKAAAAGRGQGYGKRYNVQGPEVIAQWRTTRNTSPIYGWTQDNKTFVRNRFNTQHAGAVPQGDQGRIQGDVDKTLTHMLPQGNEWRVKVLPGRYRVTVRFGDTQFASTSNIAVNDTVLVQGKTKERVRVKTAPTL